MRPYRDTLFDCFPQIPVPSTIDHSVLGYTPWHTACGRHLALTRAALAIRTTQFTIIDAHNITRAIFRQTADILRPSHSGLIADKWMIAVSVIGARNTIEPIHLIEALHLISIVQAMSTDQPRIAMRVIHALGAELAFRFGTRGLAHAGETGIRACAWLSDEFFDVASS